MFCVTDNQDEVEAFEKLHYKIEHLSPLTKNLVKKKAKDSHYSEHVDHYLN